MSAPVRAIPRRSFLTLCAALGVGVPACSGGGTADDGRSADGAGGEGADGIERIRVDYGDHGEAFADLWLPADSDGPLAVVVLVHGGFWREEFRLDLMDGLAESLVRNGYAAWNIEYRRVGGGGGYPETFDDVAAAIDSLASLDGGLASRIDLDRVAVVGHSAGGHLAGWLASRHVLPADAPWADPAVRPVVAFPQAGVLDLVGCAAAGLGDGACPRLLGGGPDDVPERYRLASPLELVPTGVPVLAVHGDLDTIVPLEQSETYIAAATDAGDPAELVVVEGADHFSVIDPDHAAWRAILDRLPDHL